MPFPFLAAGSALASYVFRPKAPKFDVRGIINRFLSSDPTATLDPNDLAVGERARSRGAEAIGQGVSVARGSAARRLASRGIDGPASEQAFADIEQGGAVARAGVNRDVADLLENIRQRKLDFSRQKAFTAFGAEMGNIGQERALYGQQSSAFWNSALPLVGQLAGLKFPVKGAPSTPKDWEFMPPAGD